MHKILSFSRAQRKTRKRDGKKFPFRIVELTLRERGNGDRYYGVYSHREKKRFLEAMAFTRAVPQSVTWVESTSSVAWKSISACIFNLWPRYMASNLWPFSKPKYFAHPGRVCVCVCVYSATSADEARDS